MIQITPMRPNLTCQNHFDGALAYLGRSFVRAVLVDHNWIITQRPTGVNLVSILHSWVGSDICYKTERMAASRRLTVATAWPARRQWSEQSPPWGCIHTC
jgi:hypothetical protein